MKRCEKCGAVQNNRRSVCIDCGERLGKPISYEEETDLQTVFSERVDSMVKRADDFCVPVYDRVMGVIAIIAVLTCVILIYLSSAEIKSFKATMNSAHLSLDDYFADPSPFARKNELEMVGVFSLCGIVINAFAASLLLFPRMWWTLDTWGHRKWIKIDAELEPTDLYLTVHKFLGYGSFVVGIILFAAAIFHMV